MTARGWTRAVLVLDETMTVAIFVPEKMGGAKAFECGVMVYEDQTLVVAVVQADLAPLVKLVQREIARHREEQLER
jgi:hypothetical protein